MALKPVLRLKIDELFMKWITDKAVQSSLNASLNQILKGEIVTYATPQVMVYVCDLAPLGSLCAQTSNWMGLWRHVINSQERD